jgi:deazaflavin-dependent oxidoreductase (nitroreductase family)
VLTVRGRKSETFRSTPVEMMQDGDGRWLVAQYGPVNWVRNLRAAHGQLTLERGAHVGNLLAEEISA